MTIEVIGMDMHELNKAFREIGQTLHFCHNSVSCDMPGTKIPVPEGGWVNDTRRELEYFYRLEKALGIDHNDPVISQWQPPEKRKRLDFVEILKAAAQAEMPRQS
jgi:hypothetical protein